ncbi:MAG: phytanoyl-CoA dioxygenase family protein, partial [Lysobacter sp.]
MLTDSLTTQGFAHLPAAFPADQLAAIRATPDIADEAETDAGTRNLLQHSWCRALIAPLRDRLHPEGLLPAADVAVQCTLFRKGQAGNWKVALHQDLSIPVAQAIEHQALSGWSFKEGRHFVQPPVATLQRLTAVRLHLDPCGPGDGPLRVVPGSHRHGRLDPAAAAALRAQNGETQCSAQPG